MQLQSNLFNMKTFWLCGWDWVYHQLFVKAPDKPVIIGYGGGYKGLINFNVSPKVIHRQTTWSFVDIKDTSRTGWHLEATDNVGNFSVALNEP